MMGSFRLSSGGRVDRTRQLRFSFDGQRLTGLAGDTLASALLANGVHLVGRSFKYHRPRGILSAGAEEPTALVQLEHGRRTEPNLRATQVELYDGLAARSVNAWPSARLDLGALTGWAAPLLVAGFYYKTFKWPRRFWQTVYEPAIRRMAGLGRAPDGPDPSSYDKTHAHCDVLVVGAGPAGLAAALAAARSGARVILADEQAEPGGSLLATTGTIDGVAAATWAASAAAAIAKHPEAIVLRRTGVFGYYDQNRLCLVERRTDHLGPRATGVRQRLWHVRAGRVVLATGAQERPIVFPGNDLPGVMLAGAVRDYALRYGVACGSGAAFFVNNDEGWREALAVAAAGAPVAAIVDPRPDPTAELAEAARRRGIEILSGHIVTGTRGRGRLSGIEVRSVGHSGHGLGIEVDCLGVSGGWSPAVHLFSQAQGKLRYDSERGAFLPGTPAQKLAVVGAANGAMDLAAALSEGDDAGREAAGLCGFAASPVAVPQVELVLSEMDAPPHPLWLVPGKKAFVDLQNDVTAADLQLAAREGLVSVEHVKRYTTAGMGTDQGKTSNVNALAILAAATGRAIPEVGTTTFRPPYTPVSYGVLAGRDLGDRLDPIRVTPIHDRHVAAGAVFEDVGQWKRPRFYPLAGEDMAAAVARECRAARQGVAVLDASTLGKIDVAGPDAASFLDRIYTNAFSGLKIGSCRYGLMLKQDGMVFDDGVTTRLAPDRFLMTTTTGGAARVLEWLEEWLQTEWPDLKVHCTSLTEQWATVAICGPHSRHVVKALAPGMTLDPDAFPFMTMREGIVAGVPARVARISFTGELSYEINVPAGHAAAVWAAVMAAGKPLGITPYGTEAMHVLRAEKGFIIVGQDTDGTVTPDDLGMSWIVSKKKDFIGRRSLARADTVRPDRKQLVGILTDDPELVLAEGAQLIAADAALKPPVKMLGHVTSSYWSATLARSIALALVYDGRALTGRQLAAFDRGRRFRVTVASPVFHDPEGAARVA